MAIEFASFPVEHGDLNHSHVEIPEGRDFLKKDRKVSGKHGDLVGFMEHQGEDMMDLAGDHQHDPHFVDGTFADHPPELIVEL